MNEARELLYDLDRGRHRRAPHGDATAASAALTRDLPPDFAEPHRAPRSSRPERRARATARSCSTRNRIFIDRMVGIGVISRRGRASAMASPGPCCAPPACDYDVRKDDPYMVYDRFDFDVPVGTKGDNFDRFSVRFEEIEQSMRIIEQALRRCRDGPGRRSTTRARAARRSRRSTSNIEGLMHHFKLVIEGIKVPAGEVYFAGEGGNGELGFYLVSDGSGRPYRVRVRPPCFYGMGALGDMLRGHA